MGKILLILALELSLLIASDGDGHAENYQNQPLETRLCSIIMNLT